MYVLVRPKTGLTFLGDIPPEKSLKWVDDDMTVRTCACYMYVLVQEGVFM